MASSIATIEIGDDTVAKLPLLFGACSAVYACLIGFAFRNAWYTLRTTRTNIFYPRWAFGRRRDTMRLDFRGPATGTIAVADRRDRPWHAERPSNPASRVQPAALQNEHGNPFAPGPMQIDHRLRQSHGRYTIPGLWTVLVCAFLIRFCWSLCKVGVVVTILSHHRTDYILSIANASV
jgi:hypothetical protein